MVIVRLFGGLGNQMFQYAAGRALAARLGCDLKLDISAFETMDRTYALGDYAIVEQFATPAEVRKLTRGTNPIRRLFSPGVSAVHFREQSVGPYREDFTRIDAPVYLDGYWQSERYFAGIAGTIRKDLRLKSAPTGPNEEMAETIMRCESVSVHVRRGDYISNPRANAFHGACGPDYYENAVRLIKTMLRGRFSAPKHMARGHPHLFVFSDEPEWVRAQMRFDLPATVISHNPPERGCEDMRLMSMCKHHVVANSSFSWWGAWLSENEEKLVAAPRKWFQSGEADDTDLVPPAWVRL